MNGQIKIGMLRNGATFIHDGKRVTVKQMKAAGRAITIELDDGRSLGPYKMSDKVEVAPLDAGINTHPWFR